MRAHHPCPNSRAGSVHEARRMSVMVSDAHLRAITDACCCWLVSSSWGRRALFDARCADRLRRERARCGAPPKFHLGRRSRRFRRYAACRAFLEHEFPPPPQRSGRRGQRGSWRRPMSSPASAGAGRRGSRAEAFNDRVIAMFEGGHVAEHAARRSPALFHHPRLVRRHAAPDRLWPVSVLQSLSGGVINDTLDHEATI